MPFYLSLRHLLERRYNAFQGQLSNPFFDLKSIVTLHVFIAYRLYPTNYCTLIGQTTALWLDKLLHSGWTNYCTLVGQTTALWLDKLLYSGWTDYCTLVGQTTALWLDRLLHSGWINYCTLIGQTTALWLDKLLHTD